MARRRRTTKTRSKKRTRKKKGWFAQFMSEFLDGLGRELQKQTSNPEFHRKVRELGGDVYNAVKARASRK